MGAASGASRTAVQNLAPVPSGSWSATQTRSNRRRRNLLQRFGHAGRLGKFGASLAQQRGQHGATGPRGLDDQGAASGLCHGSPENAPLARHRSSLRENCRPGFPLSAGALQD